MAPLYYERVEIGLEISRLLTISIKHVLIGSSCRRSFILLKLCQFPLIQRHSQLSQPINARVAPERIEAL